MKDKEIILRYISGMMTDREEVEFERELELSDSLKSEFEKINGLLAEVNSYNSVEIDERYFSTLLPKVRERIEGGKQNYFLKIAYSLSFVLSVAIFILVSLTNGYNNNFSDLFYFSESELDTTDFKSISLLLDSDFIYNPEYISSNYSVSELEENLLESYIGESFDYDLLDVPVIDDYSVLEEIEKNNVEQIYNKLKSINLLEVKK